MTTIAPDPGTCSHLIPSPSNAAESINSPWFFTKLMGDFMRLLVSSIADESMEDLGKLLNKDGDWSTGKDIAFASTAVISIFVVLLLIGVALLVATLVVCVCRWTCPDTEGTEPSKSSMVCVLLMYVLSAFVCFAGLLFFLTSLHQMRRGIEQIPNTLNGTIDDIGTFIGRYGHHLDCIYEKITMDMEKNLTSKMEEINRTLEKVEEMLDTKLVSETGHLFLSKADLLKTITNNTLPTQQEFDGICITMDKLKGEVGASRTVMRKQYNSTTRKVAEQREALQRIVKKLDDKIGSIQREVGKAVESSPFSAISFHLQYLAVFPAVLILILCFGFVFLLVRFICNCAGSSRDVIRPRRGVVSHVAGHVLGVGGYIGMLTGSFLFFLAAFCFVLAFIAMFLCMGLFEDPNLRVFKVIPNLEVSEPMGHETIDIQVHRTLVSCKNGFSFFDAINGDQQIARDQLKTHLVALRNHRFYELMSHTTFPSDFAGKLVAIGNAIENSSRSNPNADLKDLQTKLTTLQAKTSVLTSVSWRNDIILSIDLAQQEMEKAILDAVSGLFTSLVDFSPQCQNLLSIWDNIGRFLCSDISMPAQGVWMAAVICGIGSFVVFRALFQATLYLKNFGDEENESDEEKKTDNSNNNNKNTPVLPPTGPVQSTQPSTATSTPFTQPRAAEATAGGSKSGSIRSEMKPAGSQMKSTKGSKDTSKLAN